MSDLYFMRSDNLFLLICSYTKGYKRAELVGLKSHRFRYFCYFISDKELPLPLELLRNQRFRQSAYQNL